ncbi:PREDICTED: uncharacterized protein LOC106812263 [Priapulus caudatus]|uniref:Uncharacterized protein LOC106812263 n=1 Tax=Priapulus caudatus TaxID=37621 RepID=A0ABM1EHA8_PRICU|nr:PREDICTED: uncharacterized protein LOC106812263 [Priapulus caudatus]
MRLTKEGAGAATESVSSGTSTVQSHAHDEIIDGAVKGDDARSGVLSESLRSCKHDETVEGAGLAVVCPPGGDESVVLAGDSCEKQSSGESVSPPHANIEGAGEGCDIVVEGAGEGCDNVIEGASEGNDIVIEGASEGNDIVIEGASEGNDIVIEGAGEGNDNVIEGTSEGNDIVVDGAGEGNDIVVEGTGAGSDVVEGECLPKMVSPPDEEGRTADSSMEDGIMDSVSTSQAERADTDMAMHPKMAVADPTMAPDVHDQVGNVVKGHAGAGNRQAGEKDGASGARPRAVKHESVQTVARRLRNQQTQCGGEAAASKQLSSLQLQQAQNRKLREQRDEYKEKFRLASESLTKSLTEHDKLKRSFSVTGTSVSKMSVEMEEIREYLEVLQAEYNSVRDERLMERQRHDAEISDMTAELQGAAEQLDATRETMAAAQQEVRAKHLLLELRKTALQVEKNKSEQTTGMLRDSQMKMRQVGERAQQAAVSFATVTRESSLMALSMAGATYECSIRSHEETLASLKKRAIPYSMLQRIEQVNAECKQVVNSIHAQMTKVQHDFDQHMAALRIGCPLDNLPPIYLAALPGPPPQLCIPWDSVLPACPASTACPPATSGSTTLPAAGVLLPVSSIACTDGAKAAHAQQEIGGATAARAQPQIGGAKAAHDQHEFIVAYAQVPVALSILDGSLQLPSEKLMNEETEREYERRRQAGQNPGYAHRWECERFSGAHYYADLIEYEYPKFGDTTYKELMAKAKKIDVKITNNICNYRDFDYT